MKRIKSLIALVLALGLMAVLLTACGGNNDAEVREKLETAQEKLDAVTSMSYEISMDMDLSFSGAGLDGQTMSTHTTGTARYIVDPMAMEMNLSVDTGASATTDTLMYVMQDGDQVTAYSSLDNGASWTKATVDTSQLTQYDGKQSMDLYLENIDQFKEAGSEAINGSQATKYEGVIANDTISEVMEASGALIQMEQLGLDEETISSMYSEIGDIPVAIWIDDTSGLPVRYDLDMGNVMQGILDKALSAIGTDASGVTFTVDQMMMTMTVTGVDNVSSVELPEAAKAA